MFGIEHAHPFGLWQQVAGQAQLAGRGWVAPQQAQVRRAQAAQALLGLHPAHAQGQRRRPGGFAQAPFEAGAIKQDQAGGGFDLAGAWQLGHWHEVHLVSRAAFA
ncbi:hypothetical protein D9M70_621030 [compost metagenome]